MKAAKNPDRYLKYSSNEAIRNEVKHARQKKHKQKQSTWPPAGHERDDAETKTQLQQQWMTKIQKQTLKENQTSGHHGLGTHRSSQRSAWLRRNDGSSDRTRAPDSSFFAVRNGRPPFLYTSVSADDPRFRVCSLTFISPWMGILHRRFHIDGWKLFSIKPHFRVSSPRYVYRCLKMQRWTKLHPSMSILVCQKGGSWAFCTVDFASNSEKSP